MRGPVQIAEVIALYYEVASYLLLELLHTVRLDLVHQSTQDNTVLQNVGEVSLGELFVKNSFNPLIISI